ncbi:hypothetical protein F6P92_03570 [Streptococcus suis]|nr:hypothetical protein [Streptococcus suis]MBS8077819.1 hypothetical protein [Streptococcus suis]RRN55177.1 hypothetical protein EI218_00480 [Streptococcus suis]
MPRVFSEKERGVGKNSPKIKRVRLPPPAQLIRPDLECKTRTNLPINHCAEMLKRTLSSGPGLFAQSHLRIINPQRHLLPCQRILFYGV